jgi:acyl-CoA synthetase (AMP-forming)/AMP-acid ligase II
VDTIPAAVEEAASRFGAAEALVDGPVRLTWRELHEQVRGVTKVFAEGGIKPGDRVAICAPNTHHWVLTALGALSAGATLVPINTRFTATETADILDRTHAKALVVADDFLGRDRLAELRTGGHRVPDFVLPVSPGTPWRPLEPSGVDIEVGPDDVSDILFTAGTTGRSKGAMSAHRQALDVARAWAERGEVTVDDRYLIINPFFHSFGYKAGILACVLTGATMVPQAVYDAAAAARLVHEERITVLPGAPTIFQTMLDLPDVDLKSLRLAVTGAAVVPVPLVERMQEEFGTVLTAFGMTEAVVVTMCRPGDDARTVATTCGSPAAGFELRIGDQDELLLRGPNVMLGYLDDPEATSKAIDADGWLHTGDVGHVDERGYLTITDRLKDMYISGGFNVYPAEVEQALARMPGVADSAVVGVPDERLGEVGRAFVVRRDPELSTEDVVAYCKGVLANYKMPREVSFIDELPRNASGKVLKFQLRGRRD